MSNTQELEAQIDSLIDEAHDAGVCDRKRTARLGRLCGKLAVATCYTDDSRPEEWEPAQGDIDALEELWSGDPYRFDDATGDEAYAVFNEAYEEGVAEALDGRSETSEACDDLDDVI